MDPALAPATLALSRPWSACSLFAHTTNQKNVEDVIAAIIYSQTNITIHKIWRLFEDLRRARGEAAAQQYIAVPY